MSLKQDFNKYFDYLMKEGKLSSCTIKDLCYKCYCQGTTRISSKEVSIEEVEKWLENKEFFDFIESCISHPEQMKNECSNSGIVKVVYPCTAEDKEKCVAWPDRCEECGGDGQICGYEYIDLAKLCGVENPNKTSKNSGPSITPDEAKQLAEKLLEFVKESELSSN